jgi:hypothetical protein
MNTKSAMSQAIGQMLATHPQPNEVQITKLTQCVEACVLCAATCTACADACLAEEMVEQLAHCIRTNLDCADICQATSHILVRQTEPDWRLFASQLEVCQAACRTCAAVCDEHAEMHEHCRICAEVCRQCEQACADLFSHLPTGGYNPA